jgi:hypothetical protein
MHVCRWGELTSKDLRKQLTTLFVTDNGRWQLMGYVKVCVYIACV